MRYRIRSALITITAAMLLGNGAALAASNACKADLNGDLVVNFADLAVLKSVFFQRCNDPGPTCGDGVAQGPTEQCDDGNLLDGDGCSSTCTIEGPIVAVCGDGFADRPEQCDDGNLLDGDGCSSTCSIEGPIAVVCGDGVAQGPTEQCDDGNVLSGDGCSATCTLEPARHFPATGQTTCWNTAGAVIACPGTGQDGDLQTGSILAYQDNGDGTITDSNTGLMWEKLDDNDANGIHDWNNLYTWDNAFAVKIAALNAGGGFAGYTDWRLPNRKELDSIVNLGNANPAVSPAFNTGCTPGCAVTSCSCTQSNRYGSSSSFAFNPASVWHVSFDHGFDTAGSKNGPSFTYVRAVRGRW